MTDGNPKKPKRTGHFQRYLILGVLTVIPLLVTWIVVEFLLGLLAAFGRPVVVVLAQALRGFAPWLSDFLLDPVFQSVAAVIIVVMGLYGLGLASSQFFGRRFIAWFNSLIAHIPLVEKVYGSVARMLEAFQKRPEQVQRVVLIEFPSPEMKTIGLVTKTMTDRDTGRELAAVFVPTTPNPTNGYLEVVPVDRLISLDWSMDDALSFVISGGAVGPEAMPYARKAGEGAQEQPAPAPAAPSGRAPVKGTAAKETAAKEPAPERAPGRKKGHSGPAGEPA